MGHRRYLCEDHLWRSDLNFDGTVEKRMSPNTLSGDELLLKVNELRVFVPGKAPNVIPTDKKKMMDQGYSNNSNWTRKCILWELEYWPKLKSRHNLVVKTTLTM